MDEISPTRVSEKIMRFTKWAAVAILAAVIVALPSAVDAYSVLAHEALVDATWNSEIRPLLRRRFPHASERELVTARTYAYGGSAIQDLGYYPLGNRFVSDLLHHVRSGDFVEILLRDAHDPNEYAFALGALSHYAADNTGHPEAINRAVPIVFPKLQRKFGDRITYLPLQHQSNDSRHHPGCVA